MILIVQAMEIRVRKKNVFLEHVQIILQQLQAHYVVRKQDYAILLKIVLAQVLHALQIFSGIILKEVLVVVYVLDVSEHQPYASKLATMLTHLMNVQHHGTHAIVHAQDLDQGRTVMESAIAVDRLETLLMEMYVLAMALQVLGAQQYIVIILGHSAVQEIIMIPSCHAQAQEHAQHMGLM